jgi:hypothetical protein
MNSSGLLDFSSSLLIHLGQNVYEGCNIFSASSSEVIATLKARNKNLERMISSNLGNLKID